MRNFFKIVFGSMFGFLLGLVVLLFAFFLIVWVSVKSLEGEKVEVEKGSVLHLDLKQAIPDRTSSAPFDSFDPINFSSTKYSGLDRILTCLDKAGRDPNITGIYLDAARIGTSMANSTEIRNALLAFKETGKFVYAYADNYSQGGYYISSVADKIYLHPEGGVMLTGITMEQLFFKGSLAKLGIEPQIIRHGKYKSAIEPFILDKMSEENRLQITELINPVWQGMLGEIGVSRKISATDLQTITDELSGRNAEVALKNRMIDKIGYFDEFTNALMAAAGIKEEKELKLISLSDYNFSSTIDKGKKYTSDRIAVIYASGEIVNGQGDKESIGSDAFSKVIRDARKDKNIKAIVMRVNSPGGDALASDEIWREVKLAAKEKPFIVSMGSVAASGGYYISCAADTIVADPNTITGSIGVFGLFFNLGPMLRDKLGITTDTYKTGAYADLGNATRAMTDAEKVILQEQVDRVYTTFITRVAEGRGMTTAQVDSLGQGRVWNGQAALDAGLVDLVGGIDKAILLAADAANLKNYRIKALPEQKDPFESLLSDMSKEMETRFIQNQMGEEFRFYEAGKNWLNRSGIQARTWLNPVW